MLIIVFVVRPIIPKELVYCLDDMSKLRGGNKEYRQEK